MERDVVPNSRTLPFDHQTYLMASAPLLAAEEEHQLALRVRDGDGNARDRLIAANIRLVIRIARAFARGRTGSDLDDLIGDGFEGLLHAVRGFDPVSGHRFSTYASYWIKQSIGRALSGRQFIRLPHYVVTLMGRWDRTEARLASPLGDLPDFDQVAEELRLSDKQRSIVRDALWARRPIWHGGDSSGHQDADIVDDPEPAPLDRNDARRDRARLLVALLSGLTPRQQRIVELRCGLCGDPPALFPEMSVWFGLSSQGVQDVHKRAEGKLRKLAIRIAQEEVA